MIFFYLLLVFKLSSNYLKMRSQYGLLNLINPKLSRCLIRSYKNISFYLIYFLLKLALLFYCNKFNFGKNIKVRKTYSQIMEMFCLFFEVLNLALYFFIKPSKFNYFLNILYSIIYLCLLIITYITIISKFQNLHNNTISKKDYIFAHIPIYIPLLFIY